jgi:hypothetical protein
MADFFDVLNDKHIDCIKAQPMFFTASACANGRVNLSPKGMDGSFQIFSDKLCGYVDITGSGNETAAHIKNDGRITIMFNSFSRNALILRIYGQGRVLRPQHQEYGNYIDRFPRLKGTRQIILIDIETVQTSCGYGVPTMELVEQKETISKWVETKGEEGISEYQQQKNVKSIDGFDTGLND